MKTSIKKVIIITVFMISMFAVSTNVFATNENIQIIKTETDNIVYIKGMENTNFRFATSKEKLDPDSLDLTYINALKDDDENNIAIVDADTKYLYIKNGETKIIEIDLANSLTKAEFGEIENLTNRIKTEEIIVNQKDEQIGEIRYEEAVGGLKITDEADASYEYVLVKLPADKYSDLNTIVEEFNKSYSEKDVYSKIEFAKKLEALFYDLTSNANFSEVENMQVLQPSDSQKDDKYVVLLKKTANGVTTYDAKFMISDRTETEPEKVEEKKEVKSTAVLPVTGDSLVLFIVLGIIITAMIIVFIRIKQLQKKEQKRRWSNICNFVLSFRSYKKRRNILY